MKIRGTTCYLGILILLSAGITRAQDTNSHSKVNVLRGPAKAQLGMVAQIDVPIGYGFINGKDYQALKKAAGERVSGHELGLLRATNEDWAVVFRFDDVGYVKDTEKDSLNADKLLNAIKEGTAAGNEDRKRAGHPPIEVIGWDLPPHYDEATHNLEWAVRGSCAGELILNYNTRLLGRKGVMEVVLIVDPENLQKTLPTYRNLLAGYSFQTGENYAEFRPGDKIAKYGLGALIVGGAAVGAAKLGLFAWLAVLLKKAGKLVILAFVAIVAFFKKLFAKIFGGNRRSSPGT